MAQNMAHTSEKKTSTSLNQVGGRIGAWLRKFHRKDGDVEVKAQVHQQMDTNTEEAVRRKIRKDAYKARIRENEKASKIQARLQSKLHRRWRAKEEHAAAAKTNAAIKSQSLWKRCKAQNDFTRFMREENPPLTTVQSFCHLLNPAKVAIQETDLNVLRREVSNKLETTQQQREELSDIGKDIRTLIEGNMALRDLVSTFRKLKRNNRRDVTDAIICQKREACMLNTKRQRIASYGQVFYYLQTDPTYFIRLLDCLPFHTTERNHVYKVLNFVYNRASTPREEYHLMRFMEVSLREEIHKHCVDDIPYDELKTLKTITRFYQDNIQYKSVVQALKPALQRILKLRSEFTPRYDELSKWGTLPKNEQLQPATAKVPPRKSLFFRTDQLVQSILSSSDCIPYGIRYTARFLHQALRERLPLASEDVVMNTIGTFLYNYLIPIIENPDVYDLITPRAYRKSVQEDNIFAVTILTHVAMEPLHSTSAFTPKVAKYMTKTRPRFRSFYRDVLNVLEPGEYLGYDRFSDATAMKKPVINIPAEYITYTHALLTKYQKEVLPDDNDVVHQLLTCIGSYQNARDFLGPQKAEICLHLGGIFQPQEDLNSDMENLVTATKKLILDVIRVQRGESLHEVLITPASPAQREEHKTLMTDTTFINAPTRVTHSHIMRDHHLTLKEKKSVIQANMETLHRAGLVEDKTDYDSILNQVSKEIRMKHQLREERQTEIAMLRKATDDLSAFSKELQDRIDLHKKYRKRCLIKWMYHNDGFIDTEDVIQYTAEKLFRRGVIVQTWGKRKDLKREVLSVKLNRGSVRIKLGNVCLVLPVLHLLNLQNNNKSTMAMFHYDVDVSLFLFLVCSKLFLMETTQPAAVLTIRRGRRYDIPCISSPSRDMSVDRGRDPSTTSFSTIHHHHYHRGTKGSISHHLLQPTIITTAEGHDST